MNKSNVQTQKILQSRRSCIYYLEYCRLHMNGDRLVYAMAQGAITREWNIPSVNTSVILLGSGSSITQAAARKLASEKVGVAFTGGGGSPLFLATINEYAPTEHLTNWISFWLKPDARLSVAKYFVSARCEAIKKIWPLHQSKPNHENSAEQFDKLAACASNIEQLRGYEGEFTKSAYKNVARATNITWAGRRAGEEEQDLANMFLDQGNYLAYGLASTVLWTLGVSPGLAVNHGVTRAGGLVFDLADTIKDAIVLPIAFECAAHGVRSQEFRDSVIQAFDDYEALPNLFNFMKEAIEVGLEAQ